MKHYLKILFAICFFPRVSELSQVHMQSVDLVEMIERSELILCVSKIKEHYDSTSVYIDSKHEYPPFVTYYRKYIVKEILYQQQKHLRLGDTISVVDANNGLFMDLHKRYYLEGVSKSPLLDEYDSELPYNNVNEMIVFLNSPGDKHYSFSIRRAYEDMNKLQKIKKLIKSTKKKIK